MITGEGFVVFDADFCPRRDFLSETVPHLTDPSIGILQTPQFFSRRPQQTWVKQGARVCQELFYRMKQVTWFCLKCVVQVKREKSDCTDASGRRTCICGFL